MLRPKKWMTAASILLAGAIVVTPATPATEPLPGEAVGASQDAVKDLLSQIRYPSNAIRDHDRQLELRRLLRKNAPQAMVVIAQAKAAAPGDKAHRNVYENLAELFVGADEAIPALWPLLSSTDWKLRESAVMLLGWIGPEGTAAVPALADALSDSEPGVRMQAAFSLSEIGSLTPEAVAALARNLGDDRYPANAAATALSRHPESSLAAVKEALRSENATVRHYAATAAGRMKDHAEALLPYLVSLIRTGDPTHQIHAMRAMGKWDLILSAEHADVLVRLLQAPAVRCDAARILIKNGQHAHRRISWPVLVEEMTIEDANPRSCRSTAYHDFHQAGPDVMPALIPLLSHPARETKFRAIAALGSIEPQTEQSLRAIAGKLGDPDISGTASHGLEKIGAPAVPVLVAALAEPASLVRENAATALARIGPDAAAAVPALLAGLTDQTGMAKKMYLLALSHIAGPGSEAAVPELRASLKDPELHDLAASALARIEKAGAADLAETLVTMLQDQSRGMCPHPTAQDDLRAIGPVATAAIVAGLQDPGYGPKDQLLRIVDEFGTEALELARPVFTEWLANGDEYRALDAAEHLQRMDRRTSAEMLEAFRVHLNGGNPWYRLRGAEGIIRSKTPRNDRAVTVLEALREHEFERVRARATAALEENSRTNAATSAWTARPTLDEICNHFHDWYKARPATDASPAAYRADLAARGVAEAEIERRLVLMRESAHACPAAAGAAFDRIYGKAKPRFNTAPNALLVETVEGLKPGRALDVAMGQGRNAIYLAVEGWEVTGFDVSAEGLAIARADAEAAQVSIHTVEQGWQDFELGEDRWDLIVLSYAWVPIDDPGYVRRLRDSLRPGGRLVFEHFVDDGRAGIGVPASRQLLRLFDGLQVLRYEEVEQTSDWNNKKSPVVRFVARKQP